MGVVKYHGDKHINTLNTMFSTLSPFLIINLALVSSLPTSPPEVDHRIVNREDQERSEVTQQIQGSLVQDVKQINVLLNIPNNCNANTIYDDMIRQINNCKTGSDRGHPNLKSGCLLQIDFTRLKTDCQNSKLSFPKDTENIWHPSPSCNGGYCQEKSNFEFSKTVNTNVAFPQDSSSSNAPTDSSYGYGPQ